MDDDGTYLRHSHLIKGRRPGFGHWLVMRPAPSTSVPVTTIMVFLPAMRKPRSKSAKSAAFTRAAVALRQSQKRSIRTPLILSIEHRSSSCAETNSRRAPFFCTWLTYARSAFRAMRVSKVRHGMIGGLEGQHAHALRHQRPFPPAEVFAVSVRWARRLLDFA